MSLRLLMQRATGENPGWGAKTPASLVAKKPKEKNRSSNVTNSIKTLKMVHIKKVLRKREADRRLLGVKGEK